MTVAEFMAWPGWATSARRHELIGGAMRAMNPPRARHAEIVQNIARIVERQLPPPCRAYYAGAGVARSETDRTWREPDLVVTCVRPHRDFIREPRLIVEVLSPSTEQEDRTAKLDFYETLPSLEIVLLVWQDERRVRLRRRDGADWQDHDLVGAGTVEMRPLGLTLALDEIYADPWADLAEPDA